jgi:hypothetical protein
MKIWLVQSKAVTWQRAGCYPSGRAVLQRRIRFERRITVPSIRLNIRNGSFQGGMLWATVGILYGGAQATREARKRASWRLRGQVRVRRRVGKMGWDALGVQTKWRWIRKRKNAGRRAKLNRGNRGPVHFCLGGFCAFRHQGFPYM